MKEPHAPAAARRAGYTEHYIKRYAYKLIERPHIAAEIKRLRERVHERADKSATDVVNEISKMAFTDRVDFLKPDPLKDGEFMYKAPDELTPDQRHIVEKVTWHSIEIIVVDAEGGKSSLWRQEYNYIFADKAKALEQMGRHYGIFDDKLKISSGGQNPFMNATPAQIEKLKSSWIKTMTDPKLIEGECEEVKNGNGKG